MELSKAKEVLSNMERLLESNNKSRRENEQQRMKNYFDCVDDYSWGGLCDQAAADARRREAILVGIAGEQVEGGGTIKKEIEVYGVFTEAGEFLTSTIVNGKYGKCFIYNEREQRPSFVGYAKKQSTYTKKGLVVKKLIFDVEAEWDGKTSRSDNPIYNILSVERRVEEVKKLDDYPPHGGFLLYMAECSDFGKDMYKF